MAALSLDGITTAMVLEGALHREAFDAFVAEALVPTPRSGQVVSWDTLSVHKRVDAQRLIEARGCHRLWLPPYSPDLAPIDQAFSKVKTALRRAEARTRETLETAIGAGLATVTASDARGWFAHCGYPIPSHLL